MAFDKDFHVFPEPEPQVAGRNHVEPGNFSINRVARLWRPRGAWEPDVATLARFSHRLVDANGDAHTADAFLKTGDALDNLPLATSTNSGVLSAEDYVRFSGIDGKLPLAGGTMTGAIATSGSSGVIANGAGGALSGISIRNNGADAAFLEFHRIGVFACYLGLDTDNKLKIGGYSFGANAYEIHHSGTTASRDYLQGLTGANRLSGTAIKSPAVSSKTYYIATWGNSTTAMVGDPNRPFPLNNTTLSVPNDARIVCLDGTDSQVCYITFSDTLTDGAQRRVYLSGPFQAYFLAYATLNHSIAIVGDGTTLVGGSISTDYFYQWNPYGCSIENCRISSLSVGMTTSLQNCHGYGVSAYHYAILYYNSYYGGSPSAYYGPQYYPLTLKHTSLDYVECSNLDAYTSTVISGYVYGGFNSYNSYLFGS